MKKLILPAIVVLIIATLSLPHQIQAQSVNFEDIKAQMKKDWERANLYTVDYLNTMPANKYTFKAVDSIRSFAQQMLHLAQANLFLMSTATGNQPPAWAQSDLEHSPGAQKKDSVMYYITTSYDFCINGVKNSDISKWGEKQKVFNMFEATRFAFLNKAFEHQTHHRGQTTIYIRLQGIKPPEERLFD